MKRRRGQCFDSRAGFDFWAEIGYLKPHKYATPFRLFLFQCLRDGQFICGADACVVRGTKGVREAPLAGVLAQLGNFIGRSGDG